jgi:hypothetical protein
MTDTIELLEAIGRNATLRYAPADELVGLLEKENASDALRHATATNDSRRLLEELGQKPFQAPQITNAPGHEEEEPSPDGDELPYSPPEARHGASPKQAPRG